MVVLTTQSAYDFFIQGDNDSSTNDGIKRIQGKVDISQTTAIGNLFNTPQFQGTTVAEGHYSNHASQNINYYWHDTIQKPVYYTTSTISLLFSNLNANCTNDTTIFCYWCMLDGSHISQLTSDLNDNHTLLTAKKDTLFSFMDEGNSSGLISDIQGTTSGTAATMKNRLVSDGPFVSAKAIKLVGRMTSVFTDTMFLEVVSANPDVKNESRFNDYYAEKKKFLPSWIVDSITAIHPLTARTTRENEISSLNDTVHNLVKVLAKDAVNDTSGIRHQSLRDCLSKLETTEGALLIAKDLMETNEFDEADSLITALANVTVEDEEKERLQQQITVARIQLRNMSTGKSIMKIGQTDRDSLIAINGMELQGDTMYSPRRAKHAAGTLAGNILRSFYQNDSSKTYWEYYEEPKFPSVNGHTRMGKKDDDEKPKEPVREIKDLVKVYPNPAKSILNIQYETTEAEIYLRITDLLGRELFSKKSIGGKNTEVIATQNWSNGTYIYEIKSINRRVGSGIFMISQ